MNQKVQSFAELATNTSKQLTGSYTEWTTFLSTVGRLYKYPYSEQVLIYAQRPDATACASFDVWNHRMNRAVRRGSKGIALMDTSSGEPRLRYVFDISDTVGRDKSRRPFLWQYRDEHSEVVTADLAEHFDMPNENDLPYLLDMTADDLAAAYWDDHREDILASVPDSYLEELDEFNIEVAFRNAAGASTAYVLLSRCGINPEDYLSHEDFMSVFDFNTPDAATALGTAVSENSEQVLRQIEVTIKNFERQRRAERGMEHGEQTELPAGRGLPAARIDLGELPASGQVRTDEGAVSEGEPPGAVQPPAPEREVAPAPIGDRPDSEPAIGGAGAADGEVHGDNRADESVRPHEMGGADEQLQVQGGGDDWGRIDLQLEPETPAPAIDFGAVGPTGLKFSYRERTPSTIPFYSNTAEKEQILRDSDALKNSRGDVAAFFSDNADTSKRAAFIKGFFNNTYTEMILDNRQRAGYIAYDDVLHLWRGAYLSRDQEEYLSWDAVANMISGMMERGQWTEQTVLNVNEPIPEQITIQIDEPALPEDDYIPNLFDIAGSSIPLTNEPAGESITIKPRVSQEVIDAALTLGANDPDSRLRIIAEFMKDKPLEENARFLQAHYKENGAGFYVGKRKYSLWYDDAGLRIAPGESAMSYTAVALDWEQAAARIRELLDEGKYASQSMVYRAWPFERHRVAEALQYLHRYIDEEYKGKYLPTLTAALGGTYIYPDVVNKTMDLLDQPEQLKVVILEFTDFMKGYVHNRDILQFHYHRPQEILQGLEDLQRTPIKFAASSEYAPVERFFISQDEIDKLLREDSDRHDYRINIYKFFEEHPDKKEREKFLSTAHGIYSGLLAGNDNITYSGRGVEFTHGSNTDPYAAVKLKWPQVRKRIEELIAHDDFLSAEDREIMESREQEPEVESATPLDRAKEIINDFCLSEFDSYADFSDLSRVDIGYTTTEDGEHPMQFYADLVAYRIVYEVDGQSVFSLHCHDLDDLNGYLGNLEFDEMAALAEKEYTEQAQFKGSPASIFEPIPENPFREASADTERDAQTNRIRDTLIANTKAHFASYQIIKDAHPKDIVLFQRRDFYEMYGPDARVASVELDIRLTNHNVPELGRVAICGVPAHALDKSVEILRNKYGVTVSPVPENGAERAAYSLPAFESVADNSEPSTPRYLVTAYHPIENGFDEKLDYVTQQEAEEVARRYVDGSMEEDGFQYEGAAVFDMRERQWVYVAGHFPIHNGMELPYLPYRIDAKNEQQQIESDLPMPDSNEESPPWNTDIGSHSPWGVVQSSRKLAENVYKISTPGHGGIMVREVAAPAILSPETLKKGGMEHGWYFFEEDELAPLAYDELMQKGIIEERPYIHCEWSESSVFTGGQAYAVAEFDRLMKQADDERVKGTKAAIEKYGTWQAWYDSDDPEYSRFLGYNKVKFTLVMPDGRAFTERQDIGDGDGGVIDFLRKGSEYQEIIPILEAEVERDRALLPTVRELYEKYKAQIIDALSADEPYRNACRNSDKDNAYIEGRAAIKRAVLAAEDETLTKFYFDNARFHNDLHREVLDETYPLFLQEQERSAEENSVRDPLAPAYTVGDTVYLDNTAFTITEVRLHDVQLQDPTQTYPIFRSESKENFEKLLHRDPQNMPITDYLPYTAIGPIDDGDDLRDVLTGEGGLLDAGTREEVSEWLHNGEGNSMIAASLQERFDGHSDTMTLETGETADYSVTGNTFMLNLLDKSHTVRMYDLRTVAGVLRAMYQQELGGFSHEPAQDESVQEPSVQPAYTTKPEVIYPAEKNHLPFDVVVQTLHFDEPERNAPQNFHITDDNLGAGGAKAKYKMNMDALNTLHIIEEENRPATPEEQAVLSKYVGWGALADAFDESKPAWANEYKELQTVLTPKEYESARASTLNAHYTSPVVIRAMYQALENMGFKGGNILEPSCGVGNFFGLLPESMGASKLYGVELDGLTGRIAKQLYPRAHIEIKGYESANFQKNSFDVAIGNVPFGNYKVNDPAYNKLGFSIHNFFFAKAIDQVRPGGILAFVTSRYTMDSKSTQAREYIAQRAELLGAIRLPENAFHANAGTEVVTDILFLQKREQPTTHIQEWVYTEENKDGFAINSYFIDHPEMVLGDETVTSTAHGPDYTVAARPSADLGELLNTAITHIDGQYMEAETVAIEDEKEEVTIPADPRVKNFSYTIKKGDVYYRQDSVMVKMELGATAKARVTALIDLRDCAQRLIAEQLDGFSSNEAIRVAQQNLNWLYDNFSAKFGLINDKMNERAFSQDSSYYLLCALEILDDDGKFVRKADMFTKRTIMPHQEITHVDTATEALAVSIGERARVDLPFMAQLTSKTEDKIISELQGQIYAVPFRGQDGKPIYQTADEYLSGNVRQKLTVAQAAAASDPTYEINVDALTTALPRDLDASEIQVRLGATWIEPEYVDQFMRELLKPPIHTRNDVQVRYSPQVNVWNISNKSMIPKDDVKAYTTYGTSRVSAYALLEDALNLQDTKVYDLVEDADGRDKRVLNAKETTLAQQKQSMIKLSFQDWIFRDPDRRQTLVRKYNDEMNCIRSREYDGSHLVLAGMNPEIQLEEHQKNAVARAVYGGNTLFAHCVGAGKTFEITASAMEMKRLGLCSKSMIVVPNHLTQQWASEFLRLYPNANILVTTKRDFEKNRRKKFCSRIATGDYDAVIIGYSQFEKIPISKERQINLLHQQIEDITDGIKRAKAEAGEHYTVKYMERTKKSLEGRLEKLQGDNRKDDVVNFEDLGIDRLFVDESDNFKNMFLYTKMRNVAGLSTAEAQKSTDLFNKTRYLDEITDYKGTIFATGTPISNSITEMYTVQRYLQYNALTAMGIDHFDSWASRFGETTTTMELAPEGTGYRPRTRFAKFFNLPELMNIFHEVADIKTPDMLNLPTPEVEYHNEVAKPTDYQREYVQQLSERATAVRTGAVDSKEDNMLCITNDGRKLGLDQRLIDPLSGDDPDSKLNKCVKNILKIWQDGMEDKLTQLVFCDNSVPKKDGSFNVYDDIKSKLVAQGVPENEVAFIHDADTEVKKKELFGKVRSGTVRVLIGSTQKMGAGTNCQDRLIALHHLDCPWRPRDLTQREGRIIRRGNMNPMVHVYRYVTESTFDSYLWQTVEKKQQFIGQIMTSKSPVRSCEDVDEAALSYAEVKALCAGDPRIKERMELDVDVAKLQMIQANYRSQQYELEDKIRLYFPQEQQRLEWRIEGIQMDINTLAQYPLSEDEYIGIELCGKHFDERKPAGAVLLEECKNVKAYTSAPVGRYRGLELSVKKTNLLSETQIIIKGAVEYTFTASDSDIGNITRLDNALERLPEELEKSKANLENVKQQFESAKAEVGKPFPQEDELKSKLARIAELDIALKMKDDVPDKESVQVSSREDDAIDL